MAQAARGKDRLQPHRAQGIDRWHVQNRPRTAVREHELPPARHRAAQHGRAAHPLIRPQIRRHQPRPRGQGTGGHNLHRHPHGARLGQQGIGHLGVEMPVGQQIHHAAPARRADRIQRALQPGHGIALRRGRKRATAAQHARQLADGCCGQR